MIGSIILVLVVALSPTSGQQGRTWLLSLLYAERFSTRIVTIRIYNFLSYILFSFLLTPHIPLNFKTLESTSKPMECRTVTWTRSFWLSVFFSIINQYLLKPCSFIGRLRVCFFKTRNSKTSTYTMQPHSAHQDVLHCLLL